MRKKNFRKPSQIILTCKVVVKGQIFWKGTRAKVAGSTGRPGCLIVELDDRLAWVYRGQYKVVSRECGHVNGT